MTRQPATETSTPGLTFPGSALVSWLADKIGTLLATEQPRTEPLIAQTPDRESQTAVLITD